MTGRHSRRRSKIMATVRGMILGTVAMFLILGWIWIYLGMR
jgi:hypothetical protein